ncbi:ABC transporter C family member 10-like isoform X3 [Juglans microcarpa x Juglans regia]|uniref:ABC transporter C family member 10-like isoform X3 n=1 Tax=Juglans microcarpa x Juglans regia TaxID=2249226 RepID=UPI001B7E4A9A|nr:ABC transporter C family member 10-like isoform X3 [Juglans microcarpa x Juglans regia]
MESRRKRNMKVETPSVDRVTPFSKAGFLSRMSFWWLNPLMKTGRAKTLEDEDMPKLREADGAEECYRLFLEQLNEQKRAKPSILKALISCHWKEIFLSGCFALLKVLAISAGPLLLNAFILVAEGKKSFKYEGHLLAISFFLSKSIESISQRQWYFRSKLTGLKVRSLLIAAIYKKQLRLSNSARLVHSSGEIMNYVTLDAYRIGEFLFWFHQIWTTSLQLCLTLVIVFRAVKLATTAALVVIILTVLCNIPLAKLQHKFQSKLMVAQDERLKAISEALVNMKVLKLYAWDTHFKNVIENLRKVECRWLTSVQLEKGYHSLLFWSTPVWVSSATFVTCYFLRVPLHANNVFTFVATFRLVQDPIAVIPDAIGVFIQAKVSFARIVRFLEAPELQSANTRKNCDRESVNHSIFIKSAEFSWGENSSKPTLRNINLEVRAGEKVAICGEVGSGKSTLLAAILGEVPKTQGTIEVYGKISYVSQTAWIQTGTIQENILFGSAMDSERYRETLERCSLVKDLELLPFGDLTEIGERGVNLSGGQKQRLQLARALYQNADIFLLDDPFSALDAQTAMSVFNLLLDGEILLEGPYHRLVASSKEFLDFVNAHKETAGSERLAAGCSSHRCEISSRDITKTYAEKQSKDDNCDQLIKQEERERGDTGFKPYRQYLNLNKGFLLFSVAALFNLLFAIGQILQNSWMAAKVDHPHVNQLRLVLVYMLIGLASILFLLGRSLCTVALGLKASETLYSQLLDSLFHAPMSFYDSTPLGRILSRVSSDLSNTDLDVPFSLIFSVSSSINTCSALVVLAVVTWQVLFVSIPMIYLTIRFQRYYHASAKQLKRINGTTKSLIASHLAESMAGAMTVRAFEKEEGFLAKNLDLIDTNASPYFHSFSVDEWLIQRTEMVSAAVLASASLCMVLLPPRTFSSGFIGMALSYGLSLSNNLVRTIQKQCSIANNIISVERLNQYMHIPSEAPKIIQESRPSPDWPAVGKVEIEDLQVRYRSTAPLVLCGISCTFEGGHKIGIVGRTGSGKSTLIGALFRLVEPASGKITVDGLDVSKIGLHDLRSRLGIIPQDPTLFNGTVRYNLDPLSQHSDQEIWEVIGKCQLQESLQEKGKGLESLVVEHGSNWSVGQRQLFCLGRVLLRRRRILMLDEATASIDNATDMILQKTIRTEFADHTVIIVAHRIPTVMDCTMILAISDGKLVEYDAPTKLMKREDSLFRQLVKEYWSGCQSTEPH